MLELGLQVGSPFATKHADALDPISEMQHHRIADLAQVFGDATLGGAAELAAASDIIFLGVRTSSPSAISIAFCSPLNCDQGVHDCCLGFSCAFVLDNTKCGDVWAYHRGVLPGHPGEASVLGRRAGGLAAPCDAQPPHCLHSCRSEAGQLGGSPARRQPCGAPAFLAASADLHHCHW